MIKSLTIDNFAIIDNLNVKFENGLSIITGETGAGKSIILGALGLILGQRADSKSLKNEDRKCVIEGFFDIASYELQSFFELNDLDYDDNSIIRREIYPSGKSRAFVNDVPVRLDTLQALGENLVDIHSQHQTLKLSDSDFQLEVLDALAGNSKLLEDYSKKLSSYKKSKKLFDKLKSKQAEMIKEFDYNSYLYNELVEADLREGEKEEKEKELELLSHAEEIKSGLTQASQIMNDEQRGIISSLSELRLSLAPLQGFSKNIDSYIDRIESIIIESNDLSSEIETVAEETEFNPNLLDEINDRLQLIYNLEKKHNTDKIEELIDIQLRLQKEVESVENLDADLAKLEDEMNKKLQTLEASSSKLSKSRNGSKNKFSKSVSSILDDLGMENAELKVELEKTESYTSKGQDEIHYLFSANKGGSFQDIGKVASGGELSRVMLAVKTILSENKKLPSIIFDEIDTGVSGDIAEKIGIIMDRLAERMQVISITHLPQIASRGTLHFKVFKHDTKGTTQTEMKALSSEERIEELAKMLSGSNITDSALVHAKELLDSN